MQKKLKFRIKYGKCFKILENLKVCVFKSKATIKTEKLSKIQRSWCGQKSFPIYFLFLPMCCLLNVADFHFSCYSAIGYKLIKIMKLLSISIKSVEIVDLAEGIRREVIHSITV